MNGTKNKILILTLTTTLFLSTFCFGFPGNETEVIAVVGSREIQLADFIERYQDYLLVSDMKDNLSLRKAILNNMINEIVLHYYDNNSDLYKSDEYKKETEWNKKQAVLGYLKDRDIYANIKVTDQELRETFLKVNEKIAARHLYAETEEEAYKLYDLLKLGISFEELARSVFSDSVLSNNGGYLGYFTWGDMDPDFEDAAYSLRVGEISEPIKTAYGYSIIKVEDKVRIPLLTENEFLNKRNNLARTLKIKKKKPAEREFINNIFDKNDFKINEEMLSVFFNVLLKENFFNSEEGVNLNKNKILVTYKNKNYSLGEIKDRLSEIPVYHSRQIKTTEDIKTAVESIFVQEKLLEKAINKGYDTLSTVNDMINKIQNNSFLKFKKEEILNNASIPDSLVIEYYKNNIHRYSSPKMINLQEILVQNRYLADSLLLLINNGEDFGKLAMNYSVRKWTAQNNGVFGLTPLDKFGMMKNMLWECEMNSVIGPVQIENVYGIFKVIEKVDNKQIELDKIKDVVVHETKLEYQAEILTDYLNNIRSKVEISINEDLINSYQFLDISLK